MRNREWGLPRTAAVSQTSRSNARPFRALKPAHAPRPHERPTLNIEHPTPKSSRRELHPTITSAFGVRRSASGTAFVPSPIPQPHRSAGLRHGDVSKTLWIRIVAAWGVGVKEQPSAHLVNKLAMM
jgi:hypothetical protein